MQQNTYVGHPEPSETQFGLYKNHFLFLTGLWGIHKIHFSLGFRKAQQNPKKQTLRYSLPLLAGAPQVNPDG